MRVVLFIILSYDVINIHSCFLIRNLPKFYHKSFLIFCQNYDKSFLIGFGGAWKRRIDGSNVIERVSLLLSNMDQHSKWTRIVLKEAASKPL